MTWFAWRQFRTPALIILGLLVVVAAFFAITGPHLWSLYGDLKTCQIHGDCGSVTTSLSGGAYKLFPTVQALSVILPLLLGMFWGAPLVARELESGTYRLAWTQGVTRSRWILTKLAIVGVASVAAVGLMSVMFTWWSVPYNAVGNNRFATAVFDSSYIAPIGYAVFAVALGAAAGALGRRTVPAMATTLGGFVALRLSFAHFVRPRLLPPLTEITSFKHAQNIGFERTPTGMSFVVKGASPPNSLLVSNAVVGKHGGTVTSQWLKNNCQALFHLGPHAGKGGITSVGVRPAAFTDCMHKIALSFHQVLRYQPAYRFWTFQWLEMAIFIVFGLLLGLFSYWWVRRRIA